MKRKGIICIALVCTLCMYTGCSVLAQQTADSVDSLVHNVQGQVSQIVNEETVNEIRGRVENLISAVHLDDVADAAQTEVQYNETQTATFMQKYKDSDFCCTYKYTTGNVVGSSDFTYYKGVFACNGSNEYLDDRLSSQVQQNY